MSGNGMTGTVVKVVREKSFGFLRDQTGLERFFHRSGVTGAVFDTMHEGQAVVFDHEDSAKGPRATNIRNA